jgi:hypothetical protein
MRLVAILAGLALSCANSSPPSPPPEPSEMPSTDTTTPPPITPSRELVAWLDAQGDQLVRLPFTLVLSKMGGVETATIGVNGEPDAVTVKLSDLAMGISLKDRLRKVCKPGETCAVWLVGKWAAGESRLDVRKMDGAIDDPGAATHAALAVP